MPSMNHRIAVLAATVTAALAAPAAAAPTGQYVALGDSYSAVGNLLHSVAGSSPLCGQDQESYPQVTAKALGLRITDVACGDAATKDLYGSQFPGVNPQLDALRPTTRFVSLTLGGNDSQLLISLIASCAATDAAAVADVGAPCKAVFGNHFSDEVAADASTIAKGLRDIHARAPRAKVFVLGYPDVLPQHGRCYPQVPLTSADVAYANGIELALNRMIKTQARANHVTFIDTYTPTIGHDACQPEATRWVEPAVASGPHLFLHPNVNGEAQMAVLLERAINSSTTINRHGR